VKELTQIRHLADVYQFLSAEFEVSYTRLPINDERSPSLDDFDRLVALLKDLDPETAVYFNCQMGKGRTTTGMVIAILMRRTLDEKKNELEPADYNDQKPDFKLGQYKVIMKLVETIGKDGELIKAEVDDATDRCPHMQNLRECIHYTKEMYDKETEERRKFWKRMAINFIERYYYLILFNAYLREIGRPPQTKKAKKERRER